MALLPSLAAQAPQWLPPASAPKPGLLPLQAPGAGPCTGAHQRECESQSTKSRNASSSSIPSLVFLPQKHTAKVASVRPNVNSARGSCSRGRCREWSHSPGNGDPVTRRWFRTAGPSSKASTTALQPYPTADPGMLWAHVFRREVPKDTLPSADRIGDAHGPKVADQQRRTSHLRRRWTIAEALVGTGPVQTGDSPSRRYRCLGRGPCLSYRPSDPRGSSVRPSGSGRSTLRRAHTSRPP